MQDTVAGLTEEYREYVFGCLAKYDSGKATPELFQRDREFEARFIAVGVTEEECCHLAAAILSEWRQENRIRTSSSVG